MEGEQLNEKKREGEKTEGEKEQKMVDCQD